jgi:hypothetical protein
MKLASRHSVLVVAPTGTGKTVVGAFAIFMARGFDPSGAGAADAVRPHLPQAAFRQDN